MTTEQVDFATFVQQRFSGKLTHGSHSLDGAACFFEAQNVYEGREWSDHTDGTVNLIALNDAPWSSDDVRTAHMLPLYAITNRQTGFGTWTPEKQQAWAKEVAEQTIRQILPPTLRRVAELIPASAPALIAAALRCETEGTKEAADSARSAAYSAAYSARSAARSARSAARSARSAADAPLILACQIMVKAAQ